VVICVMIRMVRGGMRSGVVTASAYDFNSRLSCVGADDDNNVDEGEDVGLDDDDDDVYVDDDGKGMDEDTTSESWCCI
jgi:hypothetical protein